MYAVIKTGGKQYRVAEGDTFKVEKLDAEQGASIDIDQVVLVADGDDIKIGTPYVDGGKVTATVTGHGRHDKIEVIKFKRRKKYHRHQGHRQYYTELQVTGISPAAGSSAEAPAEPAPTEPVSGA
jgi:large subunit ribosomal protein L21